MSTIVTIGYADGGPLETNAQVDLLVAGTVVATANPDDAGKLVFAYDVTTATNLAVRLHPPTTN